MTGKAGSYIGAAARQEFVISADGLSGQFGKLNDRCIIRLRSCGDVQRLFDRKTEFSFAAFFLLFDFNAAADGCMVTNCQYYTLWHAFGF